MTMSMAVLLGSTKRAGHHNCGHSNQGSPSPTLGLGELVEGFCKSEEMPKSLGIYLDRFDLDTSKDVLISIIILGILLRQSRVTPNGSKQSK